MSATCAYAMPTVNWKPKVKTTAGVYQDIKRDNPEENKVEGYGKLRFENSFGWKEYDLFSQINFEVKHRSFISDKDQRRTNAYLREAYLELRKPDYSLSVGNQIVTWGKLDNVAILDIVSPQDYSSFILNNKQDRKIPVFMVKAQKKIEPFKFEAALMPFFKPSYVDFFGSDWSVFGQIKKAIQNSGSYGQSTRDTVNNIQAGKKSKYSDKSLKNGQVALRMSGKVKEVDYGLYYMNINSRLPALKEKTAKGNTVKRFLYQPSADHLQAMVNENPSGDDLLLVQEYPRMHIAGADYETVLGEFGLRGEAGMFFGSPYISYDDFSYTRKNTLSYGMGVDHTAADSTYFNVQFIANSIFNYEDLFAQEKNDCRMTGKISKDFLRGKLLWSFDSSFSFSYYDWMLNPELTYKFNKGFDLALGTFIFEGRDSTVMGRYSSKDVIYFELSRQF